MAARSNSELGFERFVAAPERIQTLRAGWGYYDQASGARGVWAANTQDCGDPGWTPGGEGYANWRMVPLTGEGGLPVWAKGVYAGAGETWLHGGARWRSLVTQEPSVWEPGDAPTVWAKADGGQREKVGDEAAGDGSAKEPPEEGGQG
jgi:hypothetical protein